MNNINDNLGQGVLYLVGSKGYSAYEIAVQNGFEGTEEEWLASLKGDKGDTGDTGATGKSAYDVAVENGYQGSVDDWINSFLSPDYYYTETEVDSYITKKYNTIGALINANLDSGNIVLTLGYHSLGDNGGATYIIRDKTEEDVEDHGRYHFLENGKVAELLLVENDLRPEIFGAYGDGEHDDSDALQNYINDAKTGVNIYLSVSKAVYKITKQIDFKQKGIVGNGFSHQNDIYYSTNSIYVYSGNYENENEYLNNVALINVGRDIRNLQLVAASDLSNTTISGMAVNGYNVNIDNINIRGFYDQILSINATVSFRVNNLMSTGCKNAGVHIIDKDDVQSTTAYFDNCSWQWGNYPILFDKEVYGSSFKDIVIEHMRYGFRAECFIKCIFSNIWVEGSSNENTPVSWITTSASQQMVNNIYENLYIRSPWSDFTNSNGLAAAANKGGINLGNSAISVNTSVGKRVSYGVNGISTATNEWASRDSKKLVITTQPTPTGADVPHTPADLYINAPNGSLFFANNPDTDHRPVTKNILIGEDSDSNAYFGVDIYTKDRKSWKTHDNGSNTDGYFQAPMFLTYDLNNSPTPTNNGWTITKDNSDVFTVSRISGQTKDLTNPHIIVSGIVSNQNGLGDTTMIIPTIQLIESETGSYASDGTLQGFTIIFKDIDTNTVAPMRFTVAFTSSNN